MTLSRIAAPFDHPDFVFELKHDGFRSMAYISAGRCDLVSRRKYSYKSFDSLKTALAKLKVTDAILDGEICCLDSQGRSQFNELLYRRGEPVLYCFDLLWLNGQDLRQLPLIERKKRLHKLIAKSRCERVIFAPHIAKHGMTLYQEICERDLEGIVAKRRDGIYSVSGQWFKILNPNYTQYNGRHEKFTAFKGRSRRATV
jgi:bifunctional non-homologous end joining protein LigD